MNISLELVGIGMTLLMILSLCLEHARLERQERSGDYHAPSFVERFLRSFEMQESTKDMCEHAAFQKPGFLQVTRSE